MKTIACRITNTFVKKSKKTFCKRPADVPKCTTILLSRKEYFTIWMNICVKYNRRYNFFDKDLQNVETIHIAQTTPWVYILMCKHRSDRRLHWVLYTLSSQNCPGENTTYVTFFFSFLFINSKRQSRWTTSSRYSINTWSDAMCMFVTWSTLALCNMLIFPLSAHRVLHSGVLSFSQQWNTKQSFCPE